MTFLGKLAAGAASASSAMRHVDSDGHEVTIAARVDAVEVLHGRAGRMIHYEMSGEQARKVAWFLLRWLLVTSWLGAREWVLRRAMRQAFTVAGKVRPKS